MRRGILAGIRVTLSPGRLFLLIALVGLGTACSTCPWCRQPIDKRAAGGSDSEQNIEQQLVLRGSVSYLERVAMHPSADVVIRLFDVTDFPAKPVVITEKILQRPGQAPVEFELSVEPELLVDDHEYALSASIIVDGATLFSTAAPQPVMVLDAPETVRLIVSRTPANPAK